MSGNLSNTVVLSTAGTKSKGRCFSVRKEIVVRVGVSEVLSSPSFVVELFRLNRAPVCRNSERILIRKYIIASKEFE